MNTKTFLKSLPKPLILVLIAVLVLNFNFLGSHWSNVRADSSTTSVTVQNTVPNFTTNPAEATASHNGAGLAGSADNPINEGASITFNGTANDADGQNYYLLVCNVNGATPGTGGGAPTCTSGTTWCTSTSTVDDAQASCTYSSATGAGESKAWYGFACDASPSGQLCSASSNGGTLGNNGSPFYLNHRPTLTAAQDDSGTNPGGTVAWTSTSADGDTDLAVDTFQLFVCETAAFAGGAAPACTGTEICHTASGVTTNAGCSDVLGNPLPDETKTAYPYIVDNHGLVSTGSPTGVDTVLVINNTAPSLTAGTIVLKNTTNVAESLALSVEEGQTDDFIVTVEITDTNSCQNSIAGQEIASVLINVRQSEILQATCDVVGEDNNNNCYFDAANETGGYCTQTACGGTSDATADWTCYFPLKYHGDPTDASSPKAAYIWLAAALATDDDSGASSLTDGTTGQELIQFAMYDVGGGAPNISYGTLSTGATSSDITKLIEATGNVGLDTNSKASAANMCTDYPTCTNSPPEYVMAIAQQHFAATDIAWASMTALTIGFLETELNITKTITTATPASGNIHWKIQIPSNQTPDVYSGQNVIEGKVSENVEW